jgi:hypothetical protein
MNVCYTWSTILLNVIHAPCSFIEQGCFISIKIRKTGQQTEATEKVLKTKKVEFSDS